MSFEDWWSKYRFQYLNGPTKKHCEESWNARNEEVSSLTAQLAAEREKVAKAEAACAEKREISDLRLTWEYLGEELAIFWMNPYENKKEKIASFWWPLHPAEATKEVESIFESLATIMCNPGAFILSELSQLREKAAKLEAEIAQLRSEAKHDLPKEN